jgi:hypothetical protein
VLAAEILHRNTGIGFPRSQTDWQLNRNATQIRGGRHIDGNGPSGTCWNVRPAPDRSPRNTPIPSVPSMPIVATSTSAPLRISLVTENTPPFGNRRRGRARRAPEAYGRSHRCSCADASGHGRNQQPEAPPEGGCAGACRQEEAESYVRVKCPSRLVDDLKDLKASMRLEGRSSPAAGTAQKSNRCVTYHVGRESKCAIHYICPPDWCHASGGDVASGFRAFGSESLPHRSVTNVSPLCFRATRRRSP